MNFNGWTFLLEIINFLVLAYVLHRLLYRPLRAAVDRRRAEHDAEQAAIAAARHEAEESKRLAAAGLADVEKNRLVLLDRIRAEADVRREQLLADAERAAQRRLADARKAAEQERADIFASLQEEVLRSARSLAERLLRESVDASLDEQLTKRLIETLEQTTPDEGRERPATDYAGDGSIVESSRELASATRQRLAAAVATYSGAPSAIDYRVHPELLGGVRVRIGGTVFDASLRGQLEQITLDGGRP